MRVESEKRNLMSDPLSYDLAVAAASKQNSQMNSLLRAFAVAGLILLAAGCSSVSSRIERQRAEFSTWPLEVREKIAAGKIDLGFTPEQVLVALGEPDRRFTRTTVDGTTAVWSYREHEPRISFGLGLGIGGGRHSSGRGGVMLGTGYQDEEQMGVVFDRTGQVSAIETRQK